MSSKRPLRLLFSSYHSYLDPSSGSTISMRDMFQLMKGRGWDCQVFCGPQLDYEESKSIPELLNYVNLPYDERKGGAHGLDFVLYNTVIDGIPTALYETPGRPPVRKLTEQQGRVHAALFGEVLNQFKPDILLTYGGQIMAYACMEMAKRRGIKVLFWLRNCSYNQAKFFEHCAGAIVPSTFSVDFYKQSIGLHCTSIPSALDWSRVQCDPIDRKHLTFVNPAPHKGVYIVAGIIRDLTQRRPDIPILVVESRSKAQWLTKTGVDLSKANLKGMTNTRDPKKFYSVTRVLLAPSLWQETFGRVTAESLINGIPVLASTRGGLREVVGDGGFLFNVPKEYTPESRMVPPTEHIKDIVDTIIRLWDDESFYVQACLRARVEAEKWRPERLTDQYEEYFRGLVGSRAPA